MSLHQRIQEYVRASEALLLTLPELSETQLQAVREMMHRVSKELVDLGKDGVAARMELRDAVHHFVDQAREIMSSWSPEAKERRYAGLNFICWTYNFICLEEARPCVLRSVWQDRNNSLLDGFM